MHAESVDVSGAPFPTTNRQAGKAAPWWMQTLACPGCRKPLLSEWRCSECGLAFENDGNTPVIIAKDAVGPVSFLFPQSRSEKTGEDRVRYIRYPKMFEGPLDAPYHLDRHHAELLLNLNEGARVLEIGCGGGQMRAWFLGRKMEYVGTDVSKTRVFAWLRDFGGPDLLCDAHFLPFQQQQFDVVYTAAVTEHIACPIRYLQEVRRVLKPGGYFLGNVSFLEPWHDSSHFHCSPDGVLELLLEAEFEVEAIWPGRGYDTFKAVPAMIFRRPFQAARLLGWMMSAVYRLQCSLLRLGRRINRKTPVRRIMDDAVTAGAVDWISRRPLLSPISDTIANPISNVTANSREIAIATQIV
jgi:ubiquinone/menaquinone biosynthesis C-methylase UbiE